jgi:hypothetical protein
VAELSPTADSGLVRRAELISKTLRESGADAAIALTREMMHGRHYNTRNGRNDRARKAWAECSCGQKFFGSTAGEARAALDEHLATLPKVAQP